MKKYWFCDREKKSEHYIREHEKEVPWNEVISVILRSIKNARKKGSKIEIENKRYYILCEIINKELHIINAKIKRWLKMKCLKCKSEMEKVNVVISFALDFYLKLEEIVFVRSTPPAKD